MNLRIFLESKKPMNGPSYRRKKALNFNETRYYILPAAVAFCLSLLCTGRSYVIESAQTQQLKFSYLGQKSSSQTVCYTVTSLDLLFVWVMYKTSTNPGQVYFYKLYVILITLWMFCTLRGFCVYVAQSRFFVYKIFFLRTETLWLYTLCLIQNKGMN